MKTIIYFFLFNVVTHASFNFEYLTIIIFFDNNSQQNKNIKNHEITLMVHTITHFLGRKNTCNCEHTWKINIILFS
jgi:hypothetical protein